MEEHYWTKMNAILWGQIDYIQWVWWLTCQFWIVNLTSLFTSMTEFAAVDLRQMTVTH